MPASARAALWIDDNSGELVMHSTRRTLLHGTWIAAAAGTLLAQPQAASAATTEDQTYVVPIPSPLDLNADHTTHLLQHMQLARDQLAKRVIIPFIDPTNPSARWRISDYLTAWSGLELMIGPILATRWWRPIVYVPVTAPGATIYFQDAQGIRLDSYTKYSEYPGDPNDKLFGISFRASHTAVMAFGSRTTVRGYIHHFRIGAFTSNWNEPLEANSGRPVGIDIEIEVHDVDFGIMFSAQKSGRFVARGNHLRTDDSADEPHLIYATNHTTRSQDCTVIVDCWAQEDGLGGKEGVPLLLKANENAYIPSITCRGTNGMLEIVNEYGPTKIGDMLGFDIGTEGLNFNTGGPKVSGVLLGYTSSSVNAPWTEPPHPKSVESLRVSLRANAASALGNMRVVTLNEGSWSIGSIDIEYEVNEFSEAQALIAVTGADTDIDRVRIRNRGTGGVIGISYRANTPDGHGRHVLRTPPNMHGVHTAVSVDDGITDISLNVDRALITQSKRALSAKRRAGRTFTQNTVAPVARVNRYYAFPLASAFQNVPLYPNVEYSYQILIEEPVTVASIGARVATGADNSTIRLGIRNDFGNGVPGAIVDFSGPLSATSAGDREATFGTPVTLTPGPYWLSVVAQGGSPQVHGTAAGAVASPVASLTAALSGAVVFQNNVTGEPAAAFAESGQSTAAGCARIALKFVSLA